VAMIVALGAVPGSSAAAAGVGGFIVALAGCAAINAAVLFRPSRAVAPLGPAAAALDPRQRNQQALAAARDRIERRKDARHLLQHDPDLAREMRIGRPDLPRDYDDGGLVDVNHVPGTVLETQLGLTPGEATDVLAARDKLGKFSSADELCAYTELPPDRVDELRELMIFA
jgi:DNA uptake protein ComE-like DNA-binding protein